MKVQQYKDTLLECLVTLRHARTFITSREKMHPTGIDLYDKLLIDVENALKAPEPASTQETPVVYDPHDHTHAAYVRSQETRSVDMSDQPMGDPHPADLTRNAQCPVCGCTLGYHKWNCTLNQL